MGRCSKRELKNHQAACERLEQAELTEEDRDFVFENWHPGAEHNVTWNAAFFTPANLAHELSWNTRGSGRVIDMCAGIGRLARSVLNWHRYHESNREALHMFCIEINQRYVEVGKKLVPEATWIQADVFNPETWIELNAFEHPFDEAIMNPPFGRPCGKQKWFGYSGPYDLMAVGIGLDVTVHGVTAILPPMSCPFMYSGQQSYREHMPGNVKKFLEFYPNTEFQCTSVDTSIVEGEWLGTNINTELVTIVYDGKKHHPVPTMEQGVLL